MSNGCAFILLIGFVGMMYLCSKSVYLIDSSPDESYANLTDAQRDSIDQVKHLKKMEDVAYRVARRYVRQSLNHPKTADFPILSQPLIENQGDSTFLVSHYVDAKNSFGVEGRLHYTAKVQYAGGDVDNEINWVLWDLKTDE